TSSQASRERDANMIERPSAEITSRAPSPNGNASTGETASNSDIRPQQGIDNTPSFREKYPNPVVAREEESERRLGVKSTNATSAHAESSSPSPSNRQSGSEDLISGRRTPELVPQEFSHRATVSNVTIESRQASVNIAPAPERASLNSDGRD